MIIPPHNLQPIIDTMAEYVARNGPEFEYVISKRNDPKFSFIDPTNPFYAYYQNKIAQFTYDDNLRRVQVDSPVKV